MKVAEKTQRKQLRGVRFSVTYADTAVTGPTGLVKTQRVLSSNHSHINVTSFGIPFFSASHINLGCGGLLGALLELSEIIFCISEESLFVARLVRPERNSYEKR